MFDNSNLNILVAVTVKAITLTVGGSILRSSPTRSALWNVSPLYEV